MSDVGRFVWHELHTQDRTKAQDFYVPLTGWKLKEFSMGPGEPYTLCQLGGKDHAGIMKSQAPANVPPHWLPYIHVDDVDAAAKKVTELGGKVINPPMDIPDIARFAIVMDPTGGAFAIHQHYTPYQAEPETPQVGSFCWDELFTSDPEAAANFYSALFGYTQESMDMGPAGTYRILKNGDKRRAGIMQSPPEMPGTYWSSYIAVKSVDESTKKARELNAQVMVEPQDIPHVGRFSVVQDPTGAVISFFTGM
ncbi:MAG: VOC family protein [Pseudomonadota bacterium]|nr:VOC family protein [Pseudomonadota bacterium]